MTKLIRSDTGKPLQDSDIDSGIRDIVKKLNKVTRTYYSCQGHVTYNPHDQTELFKTLMERIENSFEISTEYLELVDGAKLVQIEEPYVVFDHDVCVEDVFKDAGFKVEGAGGKRRAAFNNRKTTILLTDDTNGFIGYEQGKFGEAWNKFRKEIKRCEK